MEILRELGLRKNWVYETIITTSRDGRVNAAPMGIWTDDFEIISLDVYKTTVTCGNILQKGEFVINFLTDIEMFYKSIFNKSKLEFEKAGNVDSFYLKSADAFLEMRVVGIKDLGDRTRITSKIINSEIRKKPRLVNRAEYLALESLIAYSKLLSVSKRDGEFLEEKIKENYRVICKSAPESEFQKLVRKLLEFR